MKTSRRSFIRSASAIGALAALPACTKALDTTPKPLDILVPGQDDLPVQKWHAEMT
jgi:hypothetical protein